MICIDFRNLNAAYPKDEFLLPITDTMINNICSFERISFMDDLLGYNQIKMYSDWRKTYVTWTPLGVYCYMVMPFGLKNAGATYQCAMSTIFLWLFTEGSRMLCWRHHCQKSQQR